MQACAGILPDPTSHAASHSDMMCTQEHTMQIYVNE